MSNLVGKRFQINVSLGVDANGAPAFEVAASEIDASSVKTLPASVGMQMLNRACGMYMQILSQSEGSPGPQILVPTGKIPDIRC